MPAVLLNANNLIEESTTEEPELKNQDVSTHAAAFMILVTKDGHFVFEPDINATVVPERKPTPSEIKGALSAILMDIQSQETAIMSAQMTIGSMMQQANAAREQQLNTQMMQGLKLGR